MKQYDIIILGGGLSGLSCCALLQAEGFNCFLLEKEPELGGLTRTRCTDGFVFDRHGGHVFNTRNEHIKNWVFSLMPQEEWQYSLRKAKIEVVATL